MSNRANIKQQGFGLIIIIIAMLIIALIYFGVKNRPGQLEQSRKIEDKAVNDIEKINENLERNNLEIEKIIN